MKTPTEKAAYIIAVSIEEHPADYEIILQLMQRSFRVYLLKEASKQIKAVLDSDYYDTQELTLAILPFIDPDYAETHCDILLYGLPTWRRISEYLERRERLRKRNKTSAAQQDLEDAMLADRPRITTPHTRDSR